MAIIKVKHIKPGMVLSENVVHSTGRVLLKAGSELTEKHINIFKTWGILSLNINSEKDESIKTNKKYSPEDRKRVTSMKRVKFQHCDLSHPFMNELFRMSVKICLEQKGEKS